LLIVKILFVVMSYLPPIGHFNFAQIGHYYFALTEIWLTFITDTIIIMYLAPAGRLCWGSIM
jgi:hypothetical protein